MTEYQDSRGLMFYKGQKFNCQCGNSEFKVEVGTDPVRYWCDCGELYTEEVVNSLMAVEDGH